jgi:hypothetical protein
MLGIMLIGLVICILLIWYLWPQRAQAPRHNADAAIPDEVSLRAQPLLTQTEAAFYNVLQLAVHEQYLVFARVPIWSLVQIKAKDPKDIRVAASFINRLSKKCVDFVLVHPGTLDVEKVVELEDSSNGRPQKQLRDRMAQLVCRSAGITMIRVKRQDAYTAPALATLLGVEPRE